MFPQAFHEEYSRLYELSQEETTPQEDPRLQHVLVYFFQNKAPNRIIERTLLEQFTDRNLSFDERYTHLTNKWSLDESMTKRSGWQTPERLRRKICLTFILKQVGGQKGFADR